MKCGGYKFEIFEVALSQPQVLQGEGDESLVLEPLIWISGFVCNEFISMCWFHGTFLPVLRTGSAVFTHICFVISPSSP